MLQKVSGLFIVGSNIDLFIHDYEKLACCERGRWWSLQNGSDVWGTHLELSLYSSWAGLWLTWSCFFRKYHNKLVNVNGGWCELLNYQGFFSQVTLCSAGQASNEAVSLNNGIMLVSVNGSHLSTYLPRSYQYRIQGKIVSQKTHDQYVTWRIKQVWNFLKILRNVEG